MLLVMSVFWCFAVFRYFYEPFVLWLIIIFEVGDLAVLADGNHAPVAGLQLFAVHALF